MYPDENHSLQGVRSHLYTSLSDYFDECHSEADAERMAELAASGGSISDVGVAGIVGA